MEIWNGYNAVYGRFDGQNTIVVFPEKGTSLGRLAVKTEYWGAFPEAIEISLLDKGFHLCYIENSNRWGTDDNINRMAAFVRSVTEQYGLAKKSVPIGMSCGGLIAVKLAAQYPELVSCLYLDAPVLNYLSCPCGFGDAKVLDEGRAIPELMNALRLSSVSELIGYRPMPLDKIPELVKNRIPMVMVAGGRDQIVPYHENGEYLQKAYEESEIECQVYIKPDCDHHPHGLSDNDEVVRFILSH